MMREIVTCKLAPREGGEERRSLARWGDTISSRFLTFCYVTFDFLNYRSIIWSIRYSKLNWISASSWNCKLFLERKGSVELWRRTGSIWFRITLDRWQVFNECPTIFFFFFFLKLTTVERAGITKSTRREIFTFGLALGPRRIRIYTKTLLYLAHSVVPPLALFGI